MNKPLFGTSGIRGPADTLFTQKFSFDLGRTFAKFLRNHGENGAVAIGMDPRNSSPEISKAIQEGLAFEGRNIIDEGATSVPSMNYILLVDDNYNGAIMVSGSHIKAELNGVKFFFDKAEISKENEKEIESIYETLSKESKDSEHKVISRIENRAKEEYIERLVRLANSNYPKWRVVIDAGDGAQSDIMPQILSRLGLRVIEQNTTLQGEFFARDTEVEKDFLNLITRVIKEGADFGVGYDSDGDRVIFVDENGNFIPGDYTGALVAKSIKENTVVTPINSSQVIDNIGKRVVRTKVGSPYVVAAIKENNAGFGYEANGGGIFPDMLSRDGGRMTIEVLNILSRSHLTLSRLIAELPRFYIVRDKVEYKWDLKDEIIAEAKREFKGIRIEELDGLKVWLDKSTWILFRSSLNAPEFRVFAESKDEEVSKKLLVKGISFVKGIITKDAN